MKKADEILVEVAETLKSRGKTRDAGGGERSMARTVAAFNAIYGHGLTAVEGWQFMVLLKMVRGTQGDYNPDDGHDQTGYSALAAEEAAGAHGPAEEGWPIPSRSPMDAAKKKK